MGEVTRYSLLLLIICHIKVTSPYLFDLLSQVLKIPMPIYPICYVFELMAKHPLAVIFCNLIFFAKIRKSMPAVMRGMVLPDPDGWQKLVHLRAEGTGRFWKQLSVTPYSICDDLPDGRMDGDDAGLTSPAFISTGEIPLGCVHLYFTVFFDAESGQTHDP